MFLYHAVPSSTSWRCSFLPLGYQLLSPLFYNSFLSLQSSPHAANAQSSVPCATHTHLSLHHNTGLFATESLRESQTPFNTIFASKGLYFQVTQRKPGCPPHAHCTHVTGLNVMCKHPFQVLMTNLRSHKFKKKTPVTVNTGVSRLLTSPRKRHEGV